MSTQWRCAICETVNDGGDTCAACGATVTQTVVKPTPAQGEPARRLPARHQPAHEQAVRERPVRDEPATEIPVRKLPPRRDPYDLFDYLTGPPVPDADADYERYGRIDTTPRVRVYGCCLPLFLGIMLALAGAATVLASLVVRAL